MVQDVPMTMGPELENLMAVADRQGRWVMEESQPLRCVRNVDGEVPKRNLE